MNTASPPLRARPSNRRIARSRRQALGLAGVLAALAFAAPGMAARATSQKGPVVRDERTVRVDGVDEVWRLEWKEPPKPACGAGDAGWYTCPCTGFAFGEAGDLDLVRLREGEEVERLHLTPLFEEPAPGYGPGAIVHRVEPTDGDHDEPEDEGLAARVAARSPDPILLFADYDHDGRATEFLLQVDALPCGKRMMVAVGVSRTEPRLHALGSVAHPDEPLALRVDEWRALRDDEGPTDVVDWACDDHGSDQETELELAAHGGSISVLTRTYDCVDGERGPLVDEAAL